ncbi:flagellar hook-length control protein FliK [Photobacterium alginatilyticum]|uniref:Flagellar hook-length control protein FliK n=1 Tax=Photobacterium alginatilyticum TaxID=1775171 RepID=A0ABW9YD36_9GAMM|nr:flagellar hook-length control protein FliK [Photobacterium alginatilyticum]NBI51665.1 flagellar hook-length control protein FliK [Photobacterium alginatilyticum]
MFSSRFLTADIPSPSSAKAEGAKASSALLGEESAASPEGGRFAKELQAAAGDGKIKGEQAVKDGKNVKDERSVKGDPQAESVAKSQASSDIAQEGEAELQQPGKEISQTAAKEAATAGQGESETGKRLKNNGEIPPEVSKSQTTDHQNGQNSASQKSDSSTALDSSSKQKIMDDGEALLNRLSASNKQLASTAEDGQDGKTLPQAATASALATKSAASASQSEPVNKEQLHEKSVTPNQMAVKPVGSEQVSLGTAGKPQQGEASGEVKSKNKGKTEGKVAETVKAASKASQGQSSAELAPAALAGVGAASIKGSDNVVAAEGISKDTVSATKEKKPAAGISQEELAKVFAVPGQQTVEGLPAQQTTAQTSEPVTEGDDVSADGGIADDGMLKAFSLGAATTAAGAEVKSTQTAPQPSADLLQSSHPRSAELTKEQQVASELLDGKNKPSNVPGANTAAATAVTGALSAAASQPALSPESGQAQALNLSLGSQAQAASASGVAEAHLAGSAGTAAAVGAGAMAAMELASAEAGSDTKSPELTHTLTGSATQQGQATLQARAEAALAQSPLQLSKEQAGDQLAERVQVMMSKNLKHVDIRLDPPELGKLQIKLSLNQDQASVQFTVGNQQTRDLVEQAMPRLRELMNQQGLQLAQTSVQQDSSRQQFAGQQNQQQNQTNAGQQNSGGGQQGNGGTRHQQAESGGSEPVDMYVSQSSDRVDYYA